jgi:dCMP deaminase
LKTKEYKTYFDFACRTALNSYAERKKVGSCLITPDEVILIGWNGTSKGFDNKCEDKHGDTLNTVLHSESNAIMKATKAGISLKGSTIFTTLSPCQACSNLIVQAGIIKVVYGEVYRDTAPLEYLKQCGINVEKYLGE